jgi:hypothetical protein
MMRNPFHRQQEFTQEQREQAYAELGWGTRVERRVRRGSSEPLYFVFHLPNDARCIDVADLAAAAQGAPAWLDGAEGALRDVARESGAFLMGAICDQGDPTDVLFTITGLFSELPDAPALAVPDPPAPGEKATQEVEEISPSITRVERMTAITPPGAETPTGAVLLELYLIQTDFGGLALAFSTSHNGMFGPTGTKFFRGIVDRYWLGETPAAPQ